MADRKRQAAEAAVLKHWPPGLDGDIAEYLATTAAFLAEEDGVDSKMFREELGSAVTPHLEEHGASEEAAAAFIDAVVAAVFGEEVCAEAKAAAIVLPNNHLVYVQDLLLMYGGSGEPMLKNATLDLRRGHRYGMVGANGSGKTTLMSRIASRDIIGFPKDISVVHFRHDTILRGVDLNLSAREYASGRGLGHGTEFEWALEDAGFDDALLDKALGKLSGGWQMRLALACTVARRGSLLLLDEPTNHLDSTGVSWLAGFVKRNRADSTALIISHDAFFLNLICTDIVHFTSSAKLEYHPGTFNAFKASELQDDEGRVRALLGTPELSSRAPDVEVDKFVFPAPDKIAGATPSKPDPVVLTLSDASARYGCEGPLALSKVNVRLTLCSRIAVVGQNGSGKSTLLSMIAGRLPASGDDAAPALWTHSSLRLVYIAQLQDAQLGEFLGCTPHEYIQLRFQRGYDAEDSLRRCANGALALEEVKRSGMLARKHGKHGHGIEAILSRHCVDDDRRYQVKWHGLGPAANSFETVERIKSLGQAAMIEEFDARMSAAWGEDGPRPLSRREVARHLGEFGFSEELACERQIAMLSSGQRCRLMLAASLWTKPHVVCLDEPTNCLDPDTIAALSKALRSFKGAYVIVSHDERFVQETCNEIWHVAGGRVMQPAAHTNGTRQGTRRAQAVRLAHAGA